MAVLMSNGPLVQLGVSPLAVAEHAVQLLKYFAYILQLHKDFRRKVPGYLLRFAPPLPHDDGDFRAPQGGRGRQVQRQGE